MYGSIIGDTGGSYPEVLEINAKKNKVIRSYEERMKIMDSNTPLFTQNSSVTDDSILTCAITDSILNGISYEKSLREYGLREINMGLDMYSRSRFGKSFAEWLKSNRQGTSYGNGSAMRIGPVGFLFDSLEEVKRESYLATVPSHNHPEAILCAEAVVVSVYLLRTGYTKEELNKYIEKKYFKLDFDLEDLRRNYQFTSKAIDSVPQAIFCFLESNDFEHAIRTSISIGGDSDTIAAITGALSEAYYGVPEELIRQVRPYLKDYMLPVINQFYKKVKTLGRKK